MSSIVTQIIRSDKVESYHTAMGVVSDAQGKVIRSYGNPHHETYVRSSAKPLQAMAVIRSGAY